ncbi:hypothetical protein LPJ68_002674 [Coemansia sp. RSA 1086]|nr:hypothetical protein LPJ68_002674 [Coemansia sp. RSA 1086]
MNSTKPISGTGTGTPYPAASDVAKETGITSFGGVEVVDNAANPNYIGHGVGHRDPKTGAPVDAHIHIPTRGELHPEEFAATQMLEADVASNKEILQSEFNISNPGKYHAGWYKAKSIFNGVIGRMVSSQRHLDKAAKQGRLAALELSAYQEDNGDTPFGSYLQQTLDYAPFSDLFESINATTGTLQTRGEAHVTVVTPPEFDRVLKPAGVTIEEIDDIAKQANIQLSRLTPVCVGRFKGSLPNPKVDADKGTFLLYSLVVADEFGELLAIRKRVFELYRQRGGEGALFQPESFWPHVTIGFDRRDLFVEDGVYKGINFCYAHIHLVD